MRTRTAYRAVAKYGDNLWSRNAGTSYIKIDFSRFFFRQPVRSPDKLRFPQHAFLNRSRSRGNRTKPFRDVNGHAFRAGNGYNYGSLNGHFNDNFSQISLRTTCNFSPTIDSNGESNVREPLTLLLLALIELKTPLCVLKRHGAPRGNYACVHSAKPPKGLETEHVFFLLYVQAVSRSNRSHVIFVGKHGILNTFSDWCESDVSQ